MWFNTSTSSDILQTQNEMKKYFFIVIAAMTCFFYGCKTYQPFMSEPTNDPVRQKLPKMEIAYLSGDGIDADDLNFVKNIISSDINNNIINATGEKQGKIEVKIDRLNTEKNAAFIALSYFTFLCFNALCGMPYTIINVDMDVTFNILNTDDEIIYTHKYSTQKESTVGFYYGRDASILKVEAAKEIMKRFREDINYNSASILAKLGNKKKNGKAEATKRVEGLGTTSLENMIVRWDIQSRPQGADIFWRVVSKTPDVKSTNNKYLMTTPYEATKAIDIKGLTYETSSNVRIILRCEKEGYMSQEKEFDVRMVLDQEEISAFFRLVKE